MDSKFVELNREFGLYQADEPSEALAHSTYTLAGIGAWHRLTWANLLEHQLVVVLGEPGSGKSEELKAQHRQHEGSFLIRLEALVGQPVRNILSADEFDRFEKWRSGDGDALFLLDAVDESKLQRDDDFASAVERLSKEIGPARSRARFVVTSRVSEWRAQTDLNIVTQYLLAEPPKEAVVQDSPAADDSVETVQSEPSQPPSIVAVLQPLTPRQVKLYVEQLGARDAEQFQEALQKSNALVFAGRPLDVTHLYAYWQKEHHLSSLTDVIEFMVTKLLAEVSAKEKRDPLSPEEARQGVEYLAAAAILCKNLRFDIPDDGHLVSDARLSPAAVLPETWQPSARRALMNRAIFDSASRGTLSFHHRSHVEYLAARWIERLMENNCGFEDLSELLFADIDGKTTLRTSLAPVAAWLMNTGQEPWRGRLAELILSTAPEIHLRHGDPAALPLQYRRRVLAAIADKYKERRRVGLQVSPDALARLADSGLSNDINAYLTDDSVSDDLKSDLLMVVWEGELVGCVPTAIRLFALPSTSEDLRSYCVLAIRFAGGSEQKVEFAQIALQVDGLSNTAIGHIFETLYPDSISAGEALSVLQKVADVGRYSSEFPDMVERHLAHALRPDDATVFLRGFLDMAHTPPLAERTELSTRYHWVMSLIPICLAAALRVQHAIDTEEDVLLEAVSLIDEGLLHGHIETSGREISVGGLRELLREQYSLRRSLFWRRFAQLERPIRLDALPLYKLNQFNGLVQLHKGDIDWLLTDVEQRNDIVARLVAMSMLLQLLAQNHVSRLLFGPKLRRALLVPELGSVFVKHLWGSLSWPLVSRWHRHFKHKLLDHWWWRLRWRSVFDKYRTVRNRLWLWSHKSGLRKGKYPFALLQLVNEIRSTGGTRFSITAWDKARAKWGRTIALCIADGCVNAWQEYMPELPHEHKTPNVTNGRVIVGLVGLQTLRQRKLLDFASLSKLNVERAVRYACNELNGFPEWFFELANARAADVEAVLIEAISAEFLYPDSRTQVHEVLAKLAGAPVVTIAAGRALSRVLDRGDPLNSRVLEQVLTGVYRAGADESTKLRTLAPNRIGSYQTEQPQWTLWMGAWLRVDALPALRHLKSVLARESEEQADSAMEQLCAHLSGQPGRRQLPELPSFLEPQSLAILVPLIHAHVRPAEDIDRNNKGTYSPTTRDNAQDLRRRLWESLRSDETGKADSVLQQFLSESVLNEQRDWILSILDERQGKLADPVRWDAEDVRTFARIFRHEPRSDYQLFRLVSRLLRNFKNEVERSESAANRRQLREGDLENVFRGLLQRKLDEHSLKWFSVTEESEADLEQRPDLRVERTGLNPLPLEIKLANLKHWTIAKLLERLENQLVGQYLRPENIRFGIYVVGTTSPTRRWEYDGRRIDFNELVSLLQTRALELAAERSHKVHGLEVIGIDFSDPRERGG